MAAARFPHVHYCLLTGPDIYRSEGLPAYFRQFRRLLGSSGGWVRGLPALPAAFPWTRLSPLVAMDLPNPQGRAVEFFFQPGRM